MGNRGAAKQQCSPVNGVTEKEPATSLAARPEQRRMPHEHRSVQQLCFTPCLHMLLMQWGVMQSSWVRKWFKQGELLAQANSAHVVACNRCYKSWPLCCPFSFFSVPLRKSGGATCCEGNTIEVRREFRSKERIVARIWGPQVSKYASRDPGTVVT